MWQNGTELHTHTVPVPVSGKVKANLNYPDYLECNTEHKVENVQNGLQDMEDRMRRSDSI